LKSGSWKLYTVLIWFATEITTAMLLIAVLGEDMKIVAFLMGLLGAYLSYVTLKNKLESYPDATEDTFDFEKQ
jgi:hypothetical protein